MLKLREIHRKQEGVAMVMVLGVVTILVLLGTLTVAVSMNSTKVVNHDSQKTEADNVAQAAIDDAIAVTLANYNETFIGGNIPQATPDKPDGDPVYADDQHLAGRNNVTAGTYQVYVKEDPDTPGNVLLTAKSSSGDTLDAPNASTATVSVSVKYTASVFDYVLLVGDPNAVQDNDDDDDGEDNNHKANLKFDWYTNSDANVSIGGKTHVNGDMDIDSIRGDGNVLFSSPTSYSNTYQFPAGKPPLGSQPAQTGTVALPTVDFNSASLTGAGTAVNVVLPDMGAPTGWSRDGNLFTITAAEFQNRYGGKVVRFATNRDNAEIRIIGSSNSPVTITSSLVVLPKGAGGSAKDIKLLEVIGPGVIIDPVNGLGILSGQGEVELESGAQVGAEGHGALIYLSDQRGDDEESDFQVTNGATVFGSIVVAGWEAEFKMGDSHNDGDENDDDGDGSHDDDDHNGDVDDDHNDHDGNGDYDQRSGDDEDDEGDDHDDDDDHDSNDDVDDHDNDYENDGYNHDGDRDCGHDGHNDEDHEDDEDDHADDHQDNHDDDVNGYNTVLTYDPSFLTSLPSDWWVGGTVTAIKENYNYGH